MTDAELGIEKLAGELQDSTSGFKSLYEQTTDFARSKVRWYFNESERDWRRWTIVRGCSLAFAVLGALLPLLESTGAFPSLRLSSWGYVVLALAAGIFSIDRVFGYSAGASRNTVTWLKIRLLLAEAEFDLRGGRTRPEVAKPMTGIERLTKLRLDIETTIAEETSSWVDEFRQQQSELANRVDRSPRPRA